MEPKGDTMNALGAEMAAMVNEQKNLIDKDRKDDDSDNSDDSSEDGQPKYLFTSAIDVGSHFIDVTPNNQLEFTVREGGHFMTEFKLTNPCKTAPTAFHVYTSSPIPVRIVPQSGFIPTTFQQTIKILWEAQNQPDKERLENAMFFIKALPLAPDSDIDDMASKLDQVFNTYNVNILFTTHHLPCVVKEEQFNPGQMQQMQQRQQQMQQQQAAGGAAGGAAMSKEQWDQMNPQQQQAYRQQMAMNAQQQEQRLAAGGQQQQPQQQMTPEQWQQMNPEQQNAYRQQVAMQQQQQQARTAQ